MEISVRDDEFQVVKESTLGRRSNEHIYLAATYCLESRQRLHHDA